MMITMTSKRLTTVTAMCALVAAGVMFTSGTTFAAPKAETEKTNNSGGGGGGGGPSEAGTENGNALGQDKVKDKDATSDPAQAESTEPAGEGNNGNGNAFGQDKVKDKDAASDPAQAEIAVSTVNGNNGNGNAFGHGNKPINARPGQPFAYGVHDCRGGACKGPLPGDTTPPPGPEARATVLAGRADQDFCGYYEIRGTLLYSRWSDASRAPDSVRQVRCR